MLTLEMLSAGHGDCLWIEYGEPHALRRVLVDGGIASTHERLRARIEALPPDERHFELLVITHVDLDHIAGVLRLLRDPPAGLTFGDVWFNGWRHLLAAADEDPHDEGVLGAQLGERVSAQLDDRRDPWNRAFNGGPAAVRDGVAVLPRTRLPGGLALTLLAPTFGRLIRLRPQWRREIEEMGLQPGTAGVELEGLPGHPEDAEGEVDVGVLGGGGGDTGADLDVAALAATESGDDASRANGSSLALLAEYDGARCLLAGDAYASDLVKSVRRLADVEGAERLAVDALKLSHHGGRKNTSVELLDALRCPRYLFSTSGRIYKHPHRETVATVIAHGASGAGGEPPLLYFNYRSEQTDIWADPGRVRGGYAYEARYPVAGRDGELLVDL